MGKPMQPPRSHDIEATLASVRDSLTRLRYGSIAISIHDGRVVQLDITERQRLAY